VGHILLSGKYTSGGVQHLQYYRSRLHCVRYVLSTNRLPVYSTAGCATAHGKPR
jgi:hypothetical protein